MQKAVSRISSKMLTQTLRGMERDGLISQKLYPNIPPRVEYQLTEMGASVIEPFKTLCLWRRRTRRKRDRTRHEFDALEKEIP